MNYGIHFKNLAKKKLDKYIFFQYTFTTIFK